MEEIILFENPEFGNVRTLETDDGKVLFCGADVAKSLGYKNPSKALSDHCKGVTKCYTLTNGGKQEMAFIPESDVYRLAFGSKLPDAEKYTDWVTNEVLPSIMRTGSYSVNTVKQDSYMIEDKYERANRWMEEQRERDRLETRVVKLELKIENDAPMIEFAKALRDSDELLTIGEFACIVNQALAVSFTGISVGRNQMFEILRENGYLISQKSMRNAPSSFMSKNDYMRTVKVYNDKDRRYNTETRITHAGAMYLFKSLRNQFRKESKSKSCVKRIF